MDVKLQIEVIEGASAQTLGQATPNLSDMEAKPPSKEMMVSDSANSTEERQTVNTRENEPAQDVSVGVETNLEGEANKEQLSISEKYDTVDEVSNRKLSPLRSSVEGMEVTKAGFQTDNAVAINVEAVTNHESLDERSHLNGFENAEITLVVEMSTDTELVEGSGKREEESMLEGADTLVEHGRDAVARVEALEQVGSLLSKKGDVDAKPTALHQHAEASITESMPQQRMENVTTPDHPIEQAVPAASHLHVDEVETQTLASKKEGVIDGCSLKIIVDQAKGIERKGEQWHVHTETQIGKDTKRSQVGEDAGTSLFSTGELEAKPACILNVASGSLEEMEGVTNDEERRNREVGELAEGSIDMEVDMEAGTRASRKRYVEENIAGEPARLAEQEKLAVSETRAESPLCMQGADKADLVEGSGMGLGEEMVVIRKEQELGSITLQSELGANRRLLDNEDVQAGSLQDSEERDGIREGLGRVGETLDPTEAFGNKEAVRGEEPGQWSRSHTGMDVDSIVFEKQRMNASILQHMGSGTGENIEEGRREREADITKATSERGSEQHHQGVGSGSGLGIRQEPTTGEQCQKKDGAGKEEVQGGVLADHIASNSNKETSKEVDLVKAEQAGQRKEEAHQLFGQDLQTFPAVQGLLQNPRSKHVAVEANYTEGERRVQLERRQNRQVHAEMRVRLEPEMLLPNKSVKTDLRKSHKLMEGGSGMQMLNELPHVRSKEVKEELGASTGQHWRVGIVMQVKAKADTMSMKDKQERHTNTTMKEIGYEENQGWAFQRTTYENAACGVSRVERAGVLEEEKIGTSEEANTGTSDEEKNSIVGLEKGGTSEKASLKRKLSDKLASDSGPTNEHGQNDNVVKKAKKKAVNVWAKTSSRKGPKKNSKNGVPPNPSNEASVLLTPVYTNPDKLEDGPDQPIALSKYDKAEKIELSENRLSASSTKGYRMVRATRGVQEGAWYFEIIVEQLGPTGHTRLGWSTQKGDVQAPVGFDSNSYGYRDLEGSKTHMAVREPYGDFYVEGDVIGCYIHLPNGSEYAPKPAPLLSYRGRPYLSDIKEEHPRKVPGSEICFFRNGVCQGTAFKDINAGRYFPAASMYTLPKEPNCTVRFNFGPEFRFPPLDIGDRPEPMAMVSAPYHNVLNGKEVGSVAWANVSATGNATLNSEPQMKIV